MGKAKTYHLGNFLDFGRPKPKAWNKEQTYLCLSYDCTSKEKMFVVDFRDLNLFIHSLLGLWRRKQEKEKKNPKPHCRRIKSQIEEHGN